MNAAKQKDNMFYSDRSSTGMKQKWVQIRKLGASKRFFPKNHRVKYNTANWDKRSRPQLYKPGQNDNFLPRKQFRTEPLAKAGDSSCWYLERVSIVTAQVLRGNTTLFLQRRPDRLMIERARGLSDMAYCKPKKLFHVY